MRLPCFDPSPVLARLARLAGPAAAANVAVLAALVVSGTGCASLQRMAVANIQAPTVALTAIGVEGIDLDGVTLLVRLRVDNPNPVALALRTLSYKLELEEEQVFQGVLPEGLELAARGPTPVELPVRLRWLDLPRVARAFMSRPEVGCRVSGTAGIGTAFGTLSVPFQHTERIPTRVGEWP